MAIAFTKINGFVQDLAEKLHNLNAQDYNDKVAVVMSAVNENGRQLVELQGKVTPPLHNQIYLKPENMAVVSKIVEE